MTTGHDFHCGADAAIIQDLVTGNRILFDQKVVDAFGHLSVRHPANPNTYLMSRHLAPGLVTAQDILTFDLESNPIHDMGVRHYSERFIHGEIYKARPDVIAVVHCHAPPLIPFAATRTTLRPIYHMSGFLGCGCAQYDIREAIGVTDMLVRDPIRARALAVALGDKPIVLMRGHGATVIGISIRQVVYRAVYAAMNAQLQLEAIRLGEPLYLDPEEAQLAAEGNDKSLDRAWNLWKRDVEPKDL
jgi:ribulose-5-phosphate 4-epimerase/fuculose-1-phosphate aldolase